MQISVERFGNLSVQSMISAQNLFDLELSLALQLRQSVPQDLATDLTSDDLAGVSTAARDPMAQLGFPSAIHCSLAKVCNPKSTTRR